MSSTNDTKATEYKPFADFLDEHRKGATHAELSKVLAEVVTAVADTGKKGSITLKIKVKSSGDGMVTIEDEIKSEAPEPDRSASMFFYDELGNVSRHDPSQTRLELHDDDKVRNLK